MNSAAYAAIRDRPVSWPDGGQQWSFPPCDLGPDGLAHAAPFCGVDCTDFARFNVGVFVSFSVIPSRNAKKKPTNSTNWSKL
jgi:hypothetical protein